MKRPFLFDTCAAIWFMEAALSKSAVAVLTEAHNQGLPTHISPITAWEAGNLARKGRFKSSLAPSRWFERLLAAPGMTLCDMPPDVLIASTELPSFPNNDPADRIIAATAREYGFTVVTRDGPLLEYGKQGYLNFLEC
jgi:PIN domain nuclease of toxin-antitoxin system